MKNDKVIFALGVLVGLGMILASIPMTILKVETDSMSPTICASSFVVAWRTDRWPLQGRLRNIGSIQLVLENGRLLVKRLVGQPGDAVTYSTDRRIVVTGADARKPEPGRATVVLTDDEYFVVGDNLVASQDSRDFGAVRGAQLVARASMALHVSERSSSPKCRKWRVL